jgi:hypothetical protein
LSTLKVLAGAVTMTAVTSTFAYIVMNTPDTPAPSPGGATERRAAAPTEPKKPGDVVLCAAEDRILRVPPGFGGQCPAGQQQVDLGTEDERLCDLCDPLADQPAEDKTGNPEIDELSRRIRELEDESYFQVVDKNERPIFEIKPGGARFLNRDGKPVALLGTPAAGSFLTLRDPVNRAAVTISASGSSAGILVNDGTTTRLEVATRNAGPYAMRLPAGGGLVAGLGQSRAGTGALIIGNAGGTTLGSFTTTDGRGIAAVNAHGAKGGVALLEATIGGGMFEISNASGNNAVEMGHRSHRFGVVIAGPYFNIPYVPRTGIPGNFFVGCASGERPACVP